MELGRKNSFTGDTPTVVIKLCYNGNSLFSSPHQFVFNILEFFSSEKLNPGKTSAKSIDMLARSCMQSIIYKYLKRMPEMAIKPLQLGGPGTLYVAMVTKL